MADPTKKEDAEKQVDKPKPEPEKKDDEKAGGKGKDKKRKEFKPVEKVDAPDQTAYDKNVATLKRGIKTLDAKIDGLNLKVSENTEVRQNYRNQKRDVISKLKAIQKSKEALYQQKNEFQSKITKVGQDRKARKERAANLRKSLKFTSIEDIDKEVSAIEYRLSTSSLSLKNEKKLIEEIKILKKQKGTVAEYEEAKKLADEANLDTSEWKEKRDAKNLELRKLRDAESQHKNVLNELRRKESGVNKVVQELIDQRRQSVSEVRKLKRDLSKLTRDFEAQKKAHYRYTEHVKWVKREQRRKERKARLEEQRQEEEKEKEEEVVRHPYEKELFQCDELLRYLNRLAPQSSTTNGSTANEESKNASTDVAAQRASSFKEAKPFQKKTETLFSGIATRKKKGRKRKKGAKTNNLTHIPDIFKQFTSIGLTAPTTVDQVPASITALREKRKYYETAPPPISAKEKKELARKKKEAEAAAKKKKEEEAKAAEQAKEDAAASAAGKAKAAELENEEQKRRVAELEAQRIDAEEKAKIMRSQNRRSSLAALEQEQERRLQELESWKAAAEATTEEERKAAKAKALQLMQSEQERRVQEAKEADEKAAKEETEERERRKSLAAEMIEEERKRRMSLGTAGDKDADDADKAAAASDEVAPKDAADAAVEEPKADQDSN